MSCCNSDKQGGIIGETEMWKITRERDDGMRAGCVSAVLALFAVVTFVLWFCGLTRLESLVSIVLIFSVPGMVCGLCSQLLEERKFAKIGFYVCLTVLLIVVVVSIGYTFSGYEWKFIRYRSMWL